MAKFLNVAEYGKESLGIFEKDTAVRYVVDENVFNSERKEDIGRVLIPLTEGVLYRDGILKRHFYLGFWAETRVFPDPSFYLVFYPHFSVLQNTIMKRLKFLFCRFFCEDFKTKEESGFL